MALVVEDGSLVAGANSFVARAEVIAYAAARGVTIADDDSADVLAIKAMDYLWSLCYKGDLADEAQTTPFPRSGLIDGDTVDGYAFTIPAGVKNAQLQLSLDVHSGINLTPSANPTADLKRSKVGPLEREFFDPFSRSLTLDGKAPLTVASAWLAPFLCDGAFSLRSVRA